MQELLKLVEAREPPPPGLNIDGVIVGMLVDIGDSGEPKVMFSDNPMDNPAIASSTVPLVKGDIGKEVALLFENGNPARPIIIGRMIRPEPAVADLIVDGEKRKVEITAEHEIVLKCGRASIRLTADGRVLIRGAYISSRSSGTHRIKGGSVHLN